MTREKFSKAEDILQRIQSLNDHNRELSVHLREVLGRIAHQDDIVHETINRIPQNTLNFSGITCCDRQTAVELIVIRCAFEQQIKINLDKIECLDKIFSEL